MLDGSQRMKMDDISFRRFEEANDDYELVNNLQLELKDLKMKLKN